MNEVKDILKSMEYGPAPEAADQAELWLDRHQRKFGHYINGEFSFPKNSKTFECLNPANGQALGTLPLAGSKEVDQAADAAFKAFSKWSNLSGNQRARYLYALARLVQKHARLLAVLESLDNGKPIRETRDIDVPLVARHFYYHAGWAELIDEQIPNHEPVGVCGQIIPWNFPLLMLSWKVAPALAAGCSIVLKSAEYTPLTAIAFAEICHEAGLPKGVFNLLNGDGSTGELMVNHPTFDKVAFTGSTDVGRVIRKATAGTGKKLSLELGGKSPFIVFDDADIDAAVEGVVDAIWFNQGEVCCAGSRALVQEGIAPIFYERLRARMEKLRVGNPLDKSIDIGAVVDPTQIKNITARVEEGVKSGATLWQPTWALEVQKLSKKGCYFPPTLFTDVEPASKLAQEEIFGPVLASMTFRTPDDAMALANNSRYGLAASIWSQNLDVAFDGAKKIKAGVVWINATNLFDAAAGFGGYRESGFGREGGREGMREYLKARWESNAKTQTDFASVNPPLPGSAGISNGLDRTMKFYIGGKQARPDSGYSYPVVNPKGQLVCDVGLGNRKDIRNAVEAAQACSTWSSMTGHQRAQVLYFLAENMEVRKDELAARLSQCDGRSRKATNVEMDSSIARVMYYAAWADKYDGDVRGPGANLLTLTLNEPWGVMGISCPDEYPLLALISLVLPAIAMGNRVVVTPSPAQPLIAGDLYQILDTSDVPGGVVNLVCGDRDELARVMAKHDDIACVWYCGSKEGSANVERDSSGNLKATWVSHGKIRNWLDPKTGQGDEFLFHSVQKKTIWTPFGV